MAGGSSGGSQYASTYLQNQKLRQAKLARQSKRRAAGNGPTMPVFYPSDENYDPSTGMPKDQHSSWYGAGWGTPNYIRKLYDSSGNEVREPIRTHPGELNKEARIRLREQRVGTNNYIKAPEDSNYNNVFGRSQSNNLDALFATISAFFPGSGLISGAGGAARTAPTLSALGGKSVAGQVAGGTLATGFSAMQLGEAAASLRHGLGKYDQSGARSADHADSMNRAALSQMIQKNKIPTRKPKKSMGSSVERSNAASFYGNG